MSKLTAMQELFLSLKNTRPGQWNDVLINDEKKLLEKEKQQIQEAYSSHCGFFSCEDKEKTNCSCGKNYYETTFNNK